MIKRSILMCVVLASFCGHCSLPSAMAGERHSYGWWSGKNHHHSGSSSYSDSYLYNYNSQYANPYSYEAQNRPYWLQPSYRARSSNTYSVPDSPQDYFAAIAYSRSTGTYGYSFGKYSQADAEREALNNCDTADREIIGWVRNAHGALAVGDDKQQFGWAWGMTRSAAQQAALENCQARTSNSRIAVTVFSGN